VITQKLNVMTAKAIDVREYEAIEDGIIAFDKKT